MSNMLYQKCEACNGTRRLVRDISTNGPAVIRAGSVCPLCKDGYCPIGMTDAQQEAMHNRHDLFLTVIADLYAELHTRAAVLPACAVFAHDQLRRYAAQLCEARRRLGRPGYVPEFQPNPGPKTNG